VDEDAFRFQLLSIPGISDVSFEPAAGTFYCYVYAITPTASTSLLSSVQEALNQTAAFPLTGTALNPDLVGISLATTITLAASATQTDQQTAIAAAVQAAQNYINDLSVGQQLIINDIADQIMNLLNKCQEYIWE
jgi:phage-related baseplate assembly protein